MHWKKKPAQWLSFWHNCLCSTLWVWERERRRKRDGGEKFHSYDWWWSQVCCCFRIDIYPMLAARRVLSCNDDGSRLRVMKYELKTCFPSFLFFWRCLGCWWCCCCCCACCPYSAARTAEECDPVPTGVGAGGRSLGHGAPWTGATGTRGGPTNRTVPMRSGTDDGQSPSSAWW